MASNDQSPSSGTIHVHSSATIPAQIDDDDDLSGDNKSASPTSSRPLDGTGKGKDEYHVGSQFSSSYISHILLTHISLALLIDCIKIFIPTDWIIKLESRLGSHYYY